MLIHSGWRWPLIVALFVSVLVPYSAYGRCNGYAGSYLLSERFEGCDVNGLVESLSSDNSRAISDICMSGCYLASMNSERRSQCDSRFTAVYDRARIGDLARRANCRDRGGWGSAGAPSAEPTPAAPPPRAAGIPENSCQWTSRNTVDLTCGASGNAASGNRERNICGSGGRAICAGYVSCHQPFQHEGQTIPAGTYGVSCLTRSGYCGRVSMSECFSDKSTSPTGNEDIQPRAPAENNSRRRNSTQ
jgi:hypothetical protein